MRTLLCSSYRYGMTVTVILIIWDIHVSGADVIGIQHAEVGDPAHRQMLWPLRLTKYPRPDNCGGTASSENPGGGQELRGCPGAGLGTIFVECSVSHVMLAVLDLPVAAVAGQDVGGVGLPGGQAGDPVHGLGPAQRVPVQVVGLAVDAERLECAGEVQVRDVGAGPDGADLVAPVAAVNGDVVRGERRRPRARAGTGPRCRVRGRAGCPSR